jgi:hypothetical protein
MITSIVGRLIKKPEVAERIQIAAAFRPARVRSRISVRSNSASAAKIRNTNLPLLVVVSIASVTL